MAACCLSCFVVILYGRGDGELGSDCNTGSGEECKLVFQSRSGAFAAFTWCALLLAWECIHLRRSFFYMHPDSEKPWYSQLASDLWENQFLFWSIIFGFGTVFPLVYIQSSMTRFFFMVLSATNGESRLLLLWHSLLVLKFGNCSNAFILGISHVKELCLILVTFLKSTPHFQRITHWFKVCLVFI